ncbi:DbpA RNA binding domain-containing protein [Spirochaeta dissipatitropha]
MARELPSQETELLVGKIAELMQRLQYQEDPEEMDLLRRLFKKNVPIFRRSYFSALLLRELAKSQGIRIAGPGKPGKSERKTRVKTEKQPKPEKPKRQRPEKKSADKTETFDTPASTIPTDEEDPNTIFISIGKNRRVFPRDLIGLMASIDGVDPEKIGDIRILDNYSFVSVESSIAPLIITALHSHDYRGRKLTVNFARKKN